MTLAFWYWLLWVGGLLFSGWGWIGVEPGGRRFWLVGGGLLVWVLFLLIGLKLFGSPIRGG